MPAEAANPKSSRVAGWLRFAAIVWAVALAFEGMAAASQRVLAWASARGSIEPTLLLARVNAECANLGDLPARAELSAARAAIWQLGLNLGVATGLRNANRSTEAGLLEMSSGRAALAQQLGIPRFEIPPLVHPADALHEFGVYLQGDRDCVAARLSKMYTPRNGALFQFAAAAGHSWVYGNLAPKLGPMFVPELTVYGTRAEIPAEVWTGLTANHGDQPLEQARQEVSDAILRVERSLSPG